MQTGQTEPGKAEQEYDNGTPHNNVIREYRSTLASTPRPGNLFQANQQRSVVASFQHTNNNIVITSDDGIFIGRQSHGMRCTIIVPFCSCDLADTGMHVATAFTTDESIRNAPGINEYHIATFKSAEEIASVWAQGDTTYFKETNLGGEFAIYRFVFTALPAMTICSLSSGPIRCTKFAPCPVTKILPVGSTIR
jgi:hypothetical protein